MPEKLSELVEKLEKENASYKRLIRKCILIDDKFFDDNINDFMVLHLNRTLSYCPFPGFASILICVWKQVVIVMFAIMDIREGFEGFNYV